MDLPLTNATWVVSSYHAHHSSSGSDEMIVEITTRPTWWQRTWHKEKPKTFKVVFLGRGFDWFIQPEYKSITDTATKYRLYDLWYEHARYRKMF